MSEAAPRTELAPDEQAALTDLVLRGMHQGDLSRAQTALVEAELATARGPVLVPTQQAVRTVSAMLLVPEESPTRERIYQLFTAFLPINRQLREVCTDWQRLPDGTTNDHTDATWDAGVRDRLDDIDAGIGRILKRLTAVDEGFADYR